MIRRLLPPLFACLLILAGLTTPALAHQAALARHPAPSPDGALIAFSWQGDIWIVARSGGPARRLTVHPADEFHPIWSRDGKTLAFSSSRFGSADVFVMPADGGTPPRRLSFADAADQPLDFTPDGKAVLFASRRDESPRRSPAFYTVSVEGGSPALAQDALGLVARYSPAGDRLAFVRGGTKPYRRGYRGSASRDLWLRENDNSYRKLTAFDGDDDAPSWVDEQTLLYLSTREGRKKLFLLDLVSGESRRVAGWEDSAVRFPRASADGRIAAFEYQDAIYTMELPDGNPEKLEIETPADWLRSQIDRKIDSSGADSLAIRPDGSLAAFVVHGEVFVAAIRSKDDQAIAPSPTVRVTNTQVRESNLSWTADGKQLAFTRGSGGDNAIFLASPESGDADSDWLEAFSFKIEPLIPSGDEGVDRVSFSPEGHSLAFVRGRGQLVVAEADGRHERVLLDHWNLGSFEWSPDGRWIAYAAQDTEYNSEVFIIPAAGGDAYNISRHPDEDRAPHWSPDGRRLLWLSKRHADTLDLWSAWLTREDAERSKEGWLSLWKAQKSDGKDSGKDKGENGRSGTNEKEKDAEPARKLPAVHIDFADLWERNEALTTLRGDEGPPLATPDGKKILFSAEFKGERDLYAMRWDGSEIKRLSEGGKAPSALQFDASGKTVFYLSRGKIARISTDGKAGDPIPFEARYEVDKLEERRVSFLEGWHALNQNFYDPAFHGVDWKAQRDKYLPWAMEASTDADFSTMMNLMLGELNASHMGYYPRGRHAAAPGEKSGYIGALFDPAAGGPGLRVRELLQESPAARSDVDLKAGDRLLEVNGQPVGTKTNIYELFTDTSSQRVPIRIQDEKGRIRNAVVTPIRAGAQRQLRYRAWVKERRKIVEELSGGRLGYLHIQSMSIPPFEVFERDLYAAAHGREGLLIDVRGNGGGWTTDYLMAVLSVKRHAFTVPRGAGDIPRAYPQGRLPLAAWTRPAAALCDEDSYSNAEIFSRAFRNLKRGLLIGMPTFGAVISTGAAPTLNGGSVRVPGRGWFDAITGENQENHGVIPDIIVHRPPQQDLSKTADDQLERAVRALLESLESDPRAKAW